MFRVGEDTELGVRLVRKGLKVVYSPQLEAMHNHVDFRLADLIRRAETYGKVLVNLFQKHPDLLASGKGVICQNFPRHRGRDDLSFIQK